MVGVEQAVGGLQVDGVLDAGVEAALAAVGGVDVGGVAGEEQAAER